MLLINVSDRKDRFDSYSKTDALLLTVYIRRTKEVIVTVRWLGQN